MGVIAYVQGIVIVNRSLDWTSYTDCSVTSVACSYMFVYYVFIQISVDFCYCNIKRLVSYIIKYLRIIFESSTA